VSTRRDFITLLGGAVAAWPSAARARPGERMRRIGLLTVLAADDPVSQVHIGAFLQGLQKSGWALGQNVQIDYRWGASNTDLYRKYARELASLAPDVIVTAASSAVAALQQASRTLPIVFVTAIDPVGAGLVESIARPGGNATGFTYLELGTSGKWLELIKEMVPHVRRVAVIRDPSTSPGSGQLGAIQAVAPSLGVEVRPVDVSDAPGMERRITALAGERDVGMIVTANNLAFARRELIIPLAARLQLPTVYSLRSYVLGGGLISYGPDIGDQYRRAAGYVDRILKGEKPADLPVQAPTRYELVINLKTAKTLGLEVPATLLARANEVIE
jgi:putative tryptophan/tyrosine transport system substrate-binding protein